jgi:hypothetical protein
VYALPHANVGRLNIARETLTQYQTELDAGQLTEDILSKKIDNIVAARMQRNYNRIEPRRFLYKSGWKGQHGVNENYDMMVPHWPQLRENERRERERKKRLFG